MVELDEEHFRKFGMKPQGERVKPRANYDYLANTLGDPASWRNRCCI